MEAAEEISCVQIVIPTRLIGSHKSKEKKTKTIYIITRYEKTKAFLKCFGAARNRQMLVIRREVIEHLGTIYLILYV